MMGRKRSQKQKKVDCDTLTIGRRKKSKIEKEDRISSLPDEILIHILSFLKLEQAQRTSFVSKRWGYLWTHITSLDFDGRSFRRTSEFINWVNKVCSSIQSPSIELFRIHCALGEEDKDNVDKWVDFAMKKGVKNLQLEMHILNYYRHNRYILSCPTIVSSGFKQLRSLNLKYVNVSGEILEHFLLHSSSLEQISIQDSDHLKTLKVGVGVPLLNLKFLKIFDCYNLTDLQICAPKLSNFQYQGRPISLHIDNVPLLCHVYIGGAYGDCLSWAFSALSSQLSQIQTLVLRLQFFEACRFRVCCCSSGNMDFPLLSKLSSLRELTVKVLGRDYENLLYLLSFLKAAPSLEKFRLESELRQSKRLLEEKTVALCPHNLKVFEFHRFFDCPNTVEFVRHLSRAALRLEKVVIDPIPLWALQPPKRYPELFTKQFEELVRGGAKIRGLGSY